MHGCAQGHVVYGWQEDEIDVLLDTSCLDNRLEVYWMEQIRNNGGSPIYGIECQVEPLTGTPCISPEDQITVKNAFVKYTLARCDKYPELNDVQVKKNKKTKIVENLVKKNKLGYFVCISGDIESYRDLYSI